MPKQSRYLRDVGRLPHVDEVEPGTAVRAAELAYGVARQPPRGGHAGDGVGGLIAQRLRFHAARFGCDGVVVGELGQAAVAAEVHRQRVVDLTGSDGRVRWWEVVGGGHGAEIEYPVQAPVAASPTCGVPAQDRIGCAGHATMSECA